MILATTDHLKPLIEKHEDTNVQKCIAMVTSKQRNWFWVSFESVTQEMRIS